MPIIHHPIPIIPYEALTFCRSKKYEGRHISRVRSRHELWLEIQTVTMPYKFQLIISAFYVFNPSSDTYSTRDDSN